MRALGKTPNDPLLQKMSPIQWRLCELNVIEDEKETNEKIRTLVDIAIRMFCGSPDKEKGSEKVYSVTEGYVGQEPTMKNPDVSYTIQGTHGEQIGIRKIMSTEFDKIIESGGKYQGFEVGK